MNLEELFGSDSMDGKENGDKEMVQSFLKKISGDPGIDIATQKEAEKVLKAFERYCSAHGAEESGEDETGKEMSSLGWEA